MLSWLHYYLSSSLLLLVYIYIYICIFFDPFVECLILYVPLISSKDFTDSIGIYAWLFFSVIIIILAVFHWKTIKSESRFLYSTKVIDICTQQYSEQKIIIEKWSIFLCSSITGNEEQKARRSDWKANSLQSSDENIRLERASKHPHRYSTSVRGQYSSSHLSCVLH